MKGRKAAILAAVWLLLCGCMALLDQPYQVVSPHEHSAATAGGDSGVPDAGTYQALVNHIFSFVESGMTKGTIRLSDYTSKTGDIAGDLSAACEEVANEDPLGAYAVDFIKSDYTRVVNYYEANISITYRRTPEQVRSMVRVTGGSAIRIELRDALRQFRPETVLRVGYFSGDEGYIEELIRQAYHDTPEAAFGLPEHTVTLYPAQAPSGPRIVEIRLSYGRDIQTLTGWSQTLARRVKTLLEPISRSERNPDTVREVLLEALAAAEEPEEPDALARTAYGVLVEGKKDPDGEGAALAFQMLAHEAGLESELVSGTLDGAAHFWNLVQAADGDWRHMDALRQEDPDSAFRVDEQMSALGYGWERTAYSAAE